jgi:hypothetical protein
LTLLKLVAPLTTFFNLTRVTVGVDRRRI